MRTIIMLHGNPLSGKSIAAKKIDDAFESNGLKSEVIKSVVTRYKKPGKIKFTSESVDENIKNTKKEKDSAYNLLCQIAEEHINGYIIPIMDATFHKYYRREQVYRLGNKLNAEIIVLWLEFDDENKIREILKERQKNRDFKDNILHTWGQCRTMVKQTDSIKDYEIKNNKKIKIIRFNRTENSFDFYNCTKEEALISLICRALQD